MPFVPTTTPYAQPADLLNYGMSAAALSSPATGTPQQLAAILAASEEIDSALRQNYETPLAFWGSDVVRLTCWIASFNLALMRGFNPNGADAAYKQRYDLARVELDQFAKSERSPSIVDNSPGAAIGLSSPFSSPYAATPSPLNESTGDSTRGQR